MGVGQHYVTDISFKKLFYLFLYQPEWDKDIYQVFQSPVCIQYRIIQFYLLKFRTIPYFLKTIKSASIFPFDSGA